MTGFEPCTWKQLLCQLSHNHCPLWLFVCHLKIDYWRSHREWSKLCTCLPTYLPIIGDSNQQSYFCILWSEKMAFNWNESLSHSLASHTGGRGQLNLDHSSTQILNLLDEKFDRPVVISCQWSFYDANAHKGCNVKGVGVTFT